MQFPFSKSYSDTEQQNLVQQAIDGNKKSLNEIISFHQPFIYNVAWKMCHNPADAQDLTQEVLIKVITKLSQFNFKSKFRTWLYRIVVNEFLQSKRRKGETQFSNFDDYGERLDQVPNAELSIEEEISYQELSKEMQIQCMSGMIMCLNREQRLIFILGASFGIDHTLGADIFGISPQNFRIKLHRARKDLFNYMNNKCGLVNKENPCRCPKKAKTLKQMGVLDEEKMLFNIKTKMKVKNFVEDTHEEALNDFTSTYTKLFQEHPVKEDFDKDTIINELINNDKLSAYFKL
ncbi:RNA polymerase sigma factor [Aquimarina sp. BL5]|uniref:RNA polymerase sigma factor n=1 Tax=Aquimarina sp. BL5 TaxID=1714860 RepID=UPI000E472C18|nr:RNA polymerase sigma factor [Aquimarina sp. BL5]AXT49930.1 RNA polymerase sigma factor [Aquimarina sp. BL5]RKN01081.1 sigma-70 family RNA polymerase sigma factor [Aquimarina sp. BL5]